VRLVVRRLRSFAGLVLPRFISIGKMAASAGVKTVVLTHLPTTGDPKDEYKRFGEQVKKHFSGQVLIAKDLMEF